MNDSGPFVFYTERRLVLLTGLRAGIVANDAVEFFEKIRGVSNVSLFFHFFEARLRVERAANDFSL